MYKTLFQKTMDPVIRVQIFFVTCMLCDIRVIIFYGKSLRKDTQVQRRRCIQHALLLALHTKAKDIEFRFIIEYIVA